MPKAEIDYSNIIIYKITCKDVNVKDVYVGHTTNFVQRKHAHKQSCINVKASNHKCKLYDVIRANGGWNNWTMEIINFHNCKDHYEARKKEQEYFVSLNATLNSISPLPKPKVTVSLKHVSEINNKDETIVEAPRILEIAGNRHSPQKSHKFACEKCDYRCSKESDFSKHLATIKHNGNKKDFDGNEKIAHLFACNNCNKHYKTSSGLWKHSKVCKIDNYSEPNNNAMSSSSNEIKVLTNLVLEMIKSNTELQKQHNEVQLQNSELQKQVLEACKNSSITNNINQTNSHNKTFNLQLFLNEQCKDAMNISEFVNSFDLQLTDLESVGDLGYVQGMTKIFLDKLNAMDIYKRPMHCSDAKRETIYIKDEDKWEKEQRNNPKLRHAIKTLSFKNMKLANLWSDTYPESKSSESRLNDVYMKLVIQSTGGSGEIGESEDKIIRRIAKDIFIDKNNII